MLIRHILVTAEYVSKSKNKCVNIRLNKTLISGSSSPHPVIGIPTYLKGCIDYISILFFYHLNIIHLNILVLFHCQARS